MRAVINNEASSASAAENMTYLLIYVIVRIDSLKEGIRTFFNKYIWVLAQLLAFYSFKYPVSEYAASCIALFLYITLSLGYVAT